MTKWENKSEIINHDQVTQFLYNEVGIPQNTPITLKACDDDQTRIEILDIGMDLSDVQKSQIIFKYPELRGKEVP